jgi:uncharacterized protein (TIGR02001 family)
MEELMKHRLLAMVMTVVMLLAAAVSAGAEEGNPFAGENFSSTIILTTDYVFDGVSYSDQDPAIQGSIDYAHPDTGIFVGLWGSSWDDGGYSNDIELGIYGGQAGTLGVLDYAITLYYWHYPGAKDDGFEFDYFQAGINLSHTFEDILFSPTLTGGYIWSPEFSFEEGNYHKFLAKLGLALAHGFYLEFEAAHVDVEGGAWTGNGQGMNGGDGYDWEYYRAGISKELVAGLTLDLSYYYNSEKSFFKDFYGGNDVADPRLVFTLSRTF